MRSRLEAAPVPLAQLLADTAQRFRRTSADGRYDYDNELILALRPRNGSPGVNLLTPLRLRGDTAVLVNRGWVYSPDGLTIDERRWREGDSVHVDGFAEIFTPAEIATTTPRVARTIRRLDRDSIQARVPYTLIPIVLVEQTGRGKEAEAGTPVRVDPPPLSEGSHRSYAIQWFGLAITGIVGAALVATRDRKAAAPIDGTGSRSAE